MIIPGKHLKLSESLLGLGGTLLSFLTTSQTPDELWEKFQNYVKTEQYPTNHSFDNFILALDYLYLIGILELDQDGNLNYAPPQPYGQQTYIS